MSSPYILYVEDDKNDVYLLRYALRASEVPAQIVHVSSSEQFSAAIEHMEPDLIIADGNVPGFDTTAAMTMAKEYCPEAPFMCLTSFTTAERTAKMVASGAVCCLTKNNRTAVAAAIREALETRRRPSMNS